MPDLSFYCADDEIYLKLKKMENRSMYITDLCRKDMGVPINTTPLKEIETKAQEIPPVEIGSFKERPPVPKIEGVSLGLKDLKPDKKKCKVCGWPLNSINQCSQKSCKKFMKQQ